MFQDINFYLYITLFTAIYFNILSFQFLVLRSTVTYANVIQKVQDQNCVQKVNKQV